MKVILKRIYDLIVKLISVKGLLFICFLVLAFLIRSEQAITYAFFSGCLCVGLRTVEKYFTVINKIKAGLKDEV